MLGLEVKRDWERYATHRFGPRDKMYLAAAISLLVFSQVGAAIIFFLMSMD